MLRCCVPVTLAVAVLCFTAPAAAQGTALSSWGDDTFGEVSLAPSAADLIAVAKGWQHGVAVHADGSLESWSGLDRHGELAATPSSGVFQAVSAGAWYSLALGADGSITAWGFDLYGQVSDAPAGSGHLAVVAGDFHGLALRADRSIVGWGRDDAGQVSNAPTGTGFQQLAAGYRHSLARRADGSLVSWGSNQDGLIVNTPTGTGFLDIAAGYRHSHAIRADGSLVSWGNDALGVVSQTPPGNDFIRVSAGFYHAMALRADGSIVVWGDDRYRQIQKTPPFHVYALPEAGGFSCHALLQLDPDYDFDGLSDSFEDADGDGQVGPGETDPFDQDSDDDGLNDGEEVLTLQTDPLLQDTDQDGIQDGTESGRDQLLWDGDLDGDGFADVAGTNPGRFLPDQDPSTTTDPLLADSDGGGLPDGMEDLDFNGAIDLPDEFDPNDSGDDEFPLVIGSLIPGAFYDIDAGPVRAGSHVYVLASLVGPGPLSTSFGLDIHLSLPVQFLVDQITPGGGIVHDQAFLSDLAPPGMPIWYHSVEQLTGRGSFRVSNPVMATVQ